MAGIAHTSGTLYWATIRNLLNQYGGAVVDSDAASAYDSRAKINPFARWKPVKYPDMFRQDIDSSLSHYVDGWWRAKIDGDTYKSGRCGVNFPIYSATSFLLDVTDATSLWTHDYPTGGESEAFNPQDFRGYNPEARNIVASVSVNPAGDVSMNTNGYFSNCSVGFALNEGTDALDYTEIGYRASYDKYLDDFYFGVVAIKTSGTRYHGVVSLPYTMAELNDVTEDEYKSQYDHSAYVNLNGGVFSVVGEYDVYPVLFESAQSAKAQSSSISCTYIPLPVAPIRVNVVNIESPVKAQPISVVESSNSGTYAVGLTVTVKVVNSSASPISFSTSANGNYLEVGIARSYNYAEGGGEYNYARQTTTFSVPANSENEVQIDTPTNEDIPRSDGEALVSVRMKYGDEITTNSGYIFKF